MAMTVASIRKVKDENTYLLLKEPLFGILGREYELLTPEELKRKRTVLPKGLDSEDILTEGTVLYRNIADMIETIRRDVGFDLEKITDAKLIYTAIDTFLQAQARLIGKRIGGIKDFMVDDFTDLTRLANMMLALIDIQDRVDLMNAPKEPSAKYTSIFDLMLSGKEDKTHVVPDEVEYEDSGYQSPFSEMIKSRNRAPNRIDRFKI